MADTCKDISFEFKSIRNIDYPFPLLTVQQMLGRQCEELTYDGLECDYFLMLLRREEKLVQVRYQAWNLVIPHTFPVSSSH